MFNQTELAIINQMAFNQIRKILNKDLPYWQPQGNHPTEDALIEEQRKVLFEQLSKLRALYSKTHPTHQECSLVEQ